MRTKQIMQEEPCKEPKFKVGQLVEVAKRGSTYSTYKEMFIKHGFANSEFNGVNDEKRGRIFAVDIHPDTEEFIYAVFMADTKEVLMGEEGLKEAEIPIAIKLSDVYTAIVGRNGITVGCQTIDMDKLLEIMDAAKKVGLLPPTY